MSSHRVKDDATAVAERLKSRMQVKRPICKSPRGSRQRVFSRLWHVTIVGYLTYGRHIDTGNGMELRFS